MNIGTIRKRQLQNEANTSYINDHQYQICGLDTDPMQVFNGISVLRLFIFDPHQVMSFISHKNYHLQFLIFQLIEQPLPFRFFQIEQ